jgi:hypothetical protein
VKVRKVKGLDPDGPLVDNAQRIVLQRLDELWAFMPRAAEPGRTDELHDMRLAAKRLRDVLELTQGIFGPYAASARKRTRQLQDLLGDLHDCDVALPRVERLVDELRDEQAATVRALAGDAGDLDPALVIAVPGHGAFTGLEAMVVALRARRALLFDRFVELWTELGRQGFRARLEFALAERPPATSPSHPGNGSAQAAGLPSGATP